MKKPQKISIVIPFYNEEKTIYPCLSRAWQANVLGLKKEFVLVNDGSTDQSLKKIYQFIKKQKLTLVSQKGAVSKYANKAASIILINNQNNRGKGFAVKTGIEKTKGDIVLIQDADLEYHPQDYPDLIRPILTAEADAVYGSRFISGKPHRVLYFWHYLGNKIITFLSNLFTNLNLTDVESGFKAFRGQLIRRLASQLRSRDFGFEIEVTAKLAKVKGIKIYEVGISYWGRSYQEGKKITWRDGIKALWLTFKYHFRN